MVVVLKCRGVSEVSQVMMSSLGGDHSFDLNSTEWDVEPPQSPLKHSRALFLQL